MFNDLTNKKVELKKVKESLEIQMDSYRSNIEDLKLEVKLAQDKRNTELKRLDLSNLIIIESTLSL